MKKFTDKLKEIDDSRGGNYFGYGVHKVELLAADTGITDNGKDYIELTIYDPEDADTTDKVRLWFTTDAAVKYSFSVAHQIVVHNTKEADREKVKTAIGKVADNVELCALFNKHALGGELWYTKYLDPIRTYQAKDGTTKQSVNKSVYGYAPKLKPELLPKTQAPGQATAQLDEPFASNGKDASVPSSGEWV